MGSKQTPGMTEKKLTKEERRSAARQKAQLLREQEEKRAKRNRILVIAGIVVALALVVLAIIKIVSGSNANDDAASYGGKARGAQLQHVTSDFGIAIGKNGEALANPRADVASVGVFADLMCSHCVNLEHTSKDAYAKYLPEEKVQLINYPVHIMKDQFSRQGAAALFYIATYAPEQYSKYHAQLFDRAYKIIFEQSAKLPSLTELADLAKAVGVPDDVVKDLPASVVSEDWQKVVAGANEKFREAGWKGTPTVTINGAAENSWGTAGMGAVFEKALQIGAPTDSAASQTDSPSGSQK